MESFNINKPALIINCCMRDRHRSVAAACIMWHTITEEYLDGDYSSCRLINVSENEFGKAHAAKLKTLTGRRQYESMVSGFRRDFAEMFRLEDYGEPL